VLVDTFGGEDRVSAHATFDGLKVKMRAAVECLEETPDTDRALHTIESMTEDLAQEGCYISYEDDASYLDVSYVEIGE
jgi:glutamate-1-semialdehyde aminotransferase